MINNVVSISHFNVQSLMNKLNEFRQCLAELDHDVVGLTETWLNSNIPDNVCRFHGYSLVRVDRQGGSRGGGVLMLIKNGIRHEVVPVNNLNMSIEQIWIKLFFKSGILVIGAIYRRQEFAHSEFIENLENSLAIASSVSDNVVVIGDFNINTLRKTPLSMKFFSLLETVGYTQIIYEPTRITKHSTTLIDLIIVNEEHKNIQSGVLHQYKISDHSPVFCLYPIVKNTTIKTRTYRDYKYFNNDQFNRDLFYIQWDKIYTIPDLNCKIKFLNNNILNLINRHSQIKTINISKQNLPWITDNIKLMIKLRNSALIKFKRTKRTGHWDYYKMLRNYVTSAIKREKKAYLEFCLRKDGINSIWNELKRMDILQRSSRSIPAQLVDVNGINKAFITAGQNTFNPSTDKIRSFYNNNHKTNTCSFTFRPTNAITISQLVLALKSNASGIDNINAKMIQLCCPKIIPHILHIINCSIELTTFPDQWKIAKVLPLPKINTPKTYQDLRPISILPCLSKILEKVMALQIRQHLVNNNILPETQSGFRKGYSCTTALLNIVDDISKATDQGKLTVMVLLDYSKAFDTINHKTLLSILQYIGFDLKSINLLESYLSNRYQVVSINNAISNSLPLTQGVPQGSILGPLLYSVYTFNLLTSVKYCSCHLYADDTQLLYSFAPNQINQAIDFINQDLQSLNTFSQDHFLKINSAKSYAVLFGSKKIRERFQSQIQLTINNNNIDCKTSAKNLGLLIDSDLRFKDHISRCLRNAFIKLKLIFNNRYCLNRKIKVMLCETLVLSQFNYCDTVYDTCIDSEDSKRIQRMQNSCLRLIFGIRKFSKITHKLSDVNWLSMKSRRTLHSNCLFHKIIISQQPTYLFNKISYRSQLHNVNVRNKNSIAIPRHKTVAFEKSFSYKIGKYYNQLPSNIKSVKSMVRFREALFNYLRQQERQ